MTLIKGSEMSVVMLGFMHKMCRTKRTNIANVAGAVVLFAVALFLVRIQRTEE